MIGEKMLSYKPEKMIQYSDPFIDEDDIRAIQDCLKGGYNSSTPYLTEFEKKFAEYTGARHAIAFSNGTAALHACTWVLDLKPGDEVITTPTTFAASANAILYVGAVPVFADIDLKTYNIDPNSIESKITEKTRAIIPVHFTGQPCDLEAIYRIASKYHLSVIEDAAHALGAEYKGEMIGKNSKLAIFSFHPVKHIMTGEGGMVVTSDDTYARQLALFRSHGISRENKPEKGISLTEEPWRPDQELLGYNYRMTDFQGALGLTQLKKLPGFLKRRREIVSRYNSAFAKNNNIILPFQNPESNSSWHLYIIKIKSDKIGKTRLQLFNELRSKNVGVWVHYLPVYHHSYYQKIGYPKGLCPNSESFYGQVLTLPVYPAMTNDMVEYVIQQVNDITQ